MQCGTNEVKDLGPILEASSTRFPTALSPSHTHAVHFLPWPAVAPKLPWLADAKLLHGKAGREECPAGNHHNHQQIWPPAPGHLPTGSGQVSGSGPKTLRLGTLLCGLGNKMKIILSWARKGPRPVLCFPKVWATRSCVGFVQTLWEKNNRSLSTHPALESLQTQGTSKFLSRVVTLGFRTLDG